MDTLTFGEFVFIVTLLFIIGFWIGAKISNNYHEKEAFKAGVAEYVPDEHGAVKFQYIKVQ